MGQNKEKLAIFDIDYTLTKKETLFEFYRFMIKKKPALLTKLPKSFAAGILYATGMYELKKAKEIFISFIDNLDEENLKIYVKEFYEKVLSKILYEDSIKMIKKLENEGYKIILISASSEFYLEEFYNIKEVYKIIGTRYEKGNKGIKGKIVGENCKGEEKVKRLMSFIKEEKFDVDFSEAYMFSDSLSDSPLFKLVGHPYLINFKGKNQEFEILKWK